MRRKRRIERKGLICELPFDSLTGYAQVALHGRCAAIIEGHQGVIAMDDACIRFDSVNGVISICGSHLVLKELSLDAATVTGVSIDLVAYDDGIRRGGNVHADDA